MTSATLLTQHRNCTNGNAGDAQRDMHSENHSQKYGVSRGNFDAGHNGRFSAHHGVTPILQFAIDFAGEDGRLTANAPAPHAMQSTQQPVRTAA